MPLSPALFREICGGERGKEGFRKGCCGLAGFWGVVELSWGGGKKLCFAERRTNVLKAV